MGFSSQVNQESHPHCDLLQQLVTNPQPVSHFVHRMPSISVTTNSIISFSGGGLWQQANCDMKGIFFSFHYNYSLIMICGCESRVSGNVFISWGWNGNVLKLRSNVMSNWNLYLQSPVINSKMSGYVYTTNAQRRKFTSTITSF